MNCFINEVNEKKRLSNELRRLEYENLDLHTYQAAYGNPSSAGMEPSQEDHQDEFLNHLSQRIEKLNSKIQETKQNIDELS